MCGARTAGVSQTASAWGIVRRFGTVSMTPGRSAPALCRIPTPLSFGPARTTGLTSQTLAVTLHPGGGAWAWQGWVPTQPVGTHRLHPLSRGILTSESTPLRSRSRFRPIASLDVSEM
jgi:hypothetical protein